ncbi:MAG: hypothetical protein ACI9SJ_001661 [Flavobacteriaceae bacterium]|jgi:hypothetical protein|uniref:DUF4199 domain-containing protein n=1 Tax=Candidatus Marifrigoribacter sp. Uisw_064 TaxID=3230970 RepID=UPI003AE112D4
MNNFYIKYGFVIAGLMVAYFLILKLIGWHQYPVLSSVNGLIIGAGIFYAIRSYKRSVQVFKYEVGFRIGLLTGGLASIIFVIFMAVYIFHIDMQFAMAILKSWNINYDTGAQILLFSIFIMSCSTTVVLTLTFMQLLKESRNQNTTNF